MSTIVVGVSGPSGSGKSTLVAAVRALLDDAVAIQQDWYFKDPSECPADANFCELRWLHVEDFVRDVRTLASGQSALVPEIDFATFSRVGLRSVGPARVVVIEGMTIFRTAEIDSLCDLRYYIDEDLETIAERKHLRDVVERRKDPEIIEGQLQWITKEYHRDDGLRRRLDINVLRSNCSPLLIVDDIAQKRSHRSSCN